MAEIFQFTGKTKADVTPKQVADWADNLDEVVLVGWKDEQLYLCSSTYSVPEIIFILEHAKAALLDAKE